MTSGHNDGPPAEADIRDGAAGSPSATNADANNADAAGADAVAGPEQLEAELESLRSQYLRAVADYQNLRRRSEEERGEWTRYATTSAVVNFLPVLDDLERALRSVDPDIAERDWVEGIRMVERKFRAVLEASGVRAIPAEGAEFDPAVHEAISHAPGPEGQVIAVAQSGYMLDERVIRPARVVVGRGEGADGTSAQG